MPLPVAIIAGLLQKLSLLAVFMLMHWRIRRMDFSSRKRERMLEIMKDSRVGANGVIAICFYFLFMALYSYLFRYATNWLVIFRFTDCC